MTAVKTANSFFDSDLSLKASEHTARCRTLSPDSKIFIAGHRGMVGSAIVRRLQSEGFTNEVWGIGEPRREFLHVDDMASTCVFVMLLDDDVYEKHTQTMLSHINVGTGKDIKIDELAEIMKEVVGFKGKIIYQTNMPNGTARRLLDVSRINAMGWKASIDLREGINLTYEWFKKNWHVSKHGRQYNKPSNLRTSLKA